MGGAYPLVHPGVADLGRACVHVKVRPCNAAFQPRVLDLWCMRLGESLLPMSCLPYAFWTCMCSLHMSVKAFVGVNVERLCVQRRRVLLACITYDPLIVLAQSQGCRLASHLGNVSMVVLSIAVRC